MQMSRYVHSLTSFITQKTVLRVQLVFRLLSEALFHVKIPHLVAYIFILFSVLHFQLEQFIFTFCKGYHIIVDLLVNVVLFLSSLLPAISIREAPCDTS
jgi:hypothetical protein